MSEAHDEWEWLQGELVIEAPAGAEVAARLNAVEYADLRRALARSGYRSVEFVRKAIEHYVEHWVGPDGDQDRGFVPVDAAMSAVREDYRGPDGWLLEQLQDSDAWPIATIGICLDGDQLKALFEALDSGESSIDFVRAAVLAQVAERQAQAAQAQPAASHAAPR